MALSNQATGFTPFKAASGFRRNTGLVVEEEVDFIRQSMPRGFGMIDTGLKDGAGNVKFLA
ncbi:MAG: hypothetical protein IPL01_05980 [Acidobacteria bacterium]|nr:hypothetical protein [Acidobacteriota bacterium]